MTKAEALQILDQMDCEPKLSEILEHKAKIEEHVTNLLSTASAAFANRFRCIPVLDYKFDKSEKPWKFKMVLDLSLFE